MQGEAEWLKGDFHAHSTRSDGLLAPDLLIEEAEREGLDFFAITDHNTWAHPWFADSDEVLVMAGVEVTMPYGHFNVFSVSPEEPSWVGSLPEPGPVERDGSGGGAAASLLAEISGTGLRSSINHPLLFPWEWTDFEATLGGFDYLEVWNDPTWPENRLANPAALGMWTRWLQSGKRATAVGGSDFHNPDKFSRGDGYIVDGHRVGVPRTFVLATARTPEAILEAVDRGRAYVTMGPTLDVTFETSQGRTEIGADLGPFEGPLAVSASCSGEGELELRLIRDGEAISTTQGRNPGLEREIELTPHTGGWVRIDAVDSAGEIVAFTNPVFFGPSPEEADHRFGSFTDSSAALEINRRWHDMPPDNE